MATRIPATIVTGFLGAGKTTLVRHLIDSAAGRRIALIVNEFGELGVDGDLLGGQGDVVELSDGCICCTVNEDFEPALTKLIALAPDHIVIETSGLALPGPLVRAFGWPGIRERVVLDGVVAVADGVTLSEGVPEDVAQTFADQMAAADLVLLSKSDLIEDAAAVASALSATLRDSVQVVPMVAGQVEPSLILGLDARAMSCAEHGHHAGCGHDHHHDDQDHHGHDHDHHHDAFTSLSLDLPEVASLDALRTALGTAIPAHKLLRVKGFASVQGKPMRLVIQAVGPRIDAGFDRPLGADPRGTRLVLIGPASLDRAALAADLTAELELV